MQVSVRTWLTPQLTYCRFANDNRRMNCGLGFYSRTSAALLIGAGDEGITSSTAIKRPAPLRCGSIRIRGPWLGAAVCHTLILGTSQLPTDFNLHILSIVIMSFPFFGLKTGHIVWGLFGLIVAKLSWEIFFSPLRFFPVHY